MPKLLIDRGNTRLKWQLVDGLTLLDKGAIQNNESVDQAFLDYQIAGLDDIWVSNVTSDHFESDLLVWSKKRGLGTDKVHFVKSNQQAYGVINAYEEPERLGVDRWLAMIAARELFSGLLCVVDCGTACTLDVIDSSGQHQGGYIVPGLSMMSKSLLSNTEKIKIDQPISENFLGKNTSEAVSLGIQKSLLGFIQQAVNDLVEQYREPVSLVITGGDGAVISKGLSMESVFIPELIFKGLNRYAGIEE